MIEACGKVNGPSHGLQRSLIAHDGHFGFVHKETLLEKSVFRLAARGLMFKARWGTAEVTLKFTAQKMKKKTGNL
jgi:hypothetical protein